MPFAAIVNLAVFDVPNNKGYAPVLNISPRSPEGCVDPK
jgi:hypothetical protein